MQKLNLTQLHQLIQTANFKELFDELGWDNSSLKKPIVINSYSLTAIAEKRGFQIFICETAELPDIAERKKIA